MGYPCQLHPLPFRRVWRRVFIHIAAILGLLFLVRFSFAARSLSPGAFVASFLVRLDVIDKLAVLVGMIALS
jgi:hypothetical protein